MYSIAKALLLCGLYMTSNSQYNVYQITSQQPNSNIVQYNTQQQNKPNSQNYPNNQGAYQNQNQYPVQNKPSLPNPQPQPPINNNGPKCYPNNNFNKITCKNKNSAQCAKKSYSSTAPFTTCGVSHLGVKYDFHDEC